ncbi:MAG: response regulator [Firmicutes bacterium]|nr:response regulator [Bacillota bacterium]
MNRKILLVDDDSNILAGYQRSLRKNFEISTASSGMDGLLAIKKEGPFAVIVSDYRMPVMDGIKFLAKTRKTAPDTVRIMLTGQADLQAAIDAVNEGSLFRFLLKPCPPEDLTKTLNAGVEQYRLVTAEKELLEKTLRGSIKVMSDILSIVNPVAFSHSSRVSRLGTKIAQRLNLDNLWEVEIAVMLSQIGCVTVPSGILEKKYHGQALDPKEEEMYLEHPGAGRDLIKNIPRLERVAEGIAYQEKHYDGGGIPGDQNQGPEIPVLGRILKAILDYDLLLMGGNTEIQALNLMKEHNRRYDPEILKALEEEYYQDGAAYQIREVRIDELLTGMIIAEDILSETGVVLVSHGQEIGETLKKRLLNYKHFNGIMEPIKVLKAIGRDSAKLN